MSMPRFSAEASLYAASEHYRSLGVLAAGTFDSVLAQQLCRRLGQSCGGIDLFCCPGLTCTAGSGGSSICLPAPPSDPCARCRTLPTVCARMQCECTCNDGIPVDCSDLAGPNCNGCDCCKPCCFVCT